MPKRDSMATYAARRQVYVSISQQPKRAGPNGEPCEATRFQPHACSPTLHLNEVLFPKNVFQKKSHEDQMAFWHDINCAINCETFHLYLEGHASRYREWHLRRMMEVYGAESVYEYVADLPLKINPLAVRIFRHIQRIKEQRDET